MDMIKIRNMKLSDYNIFCAKYMAVKCYSLVAVFAFQDRICSYKVLKHLARGKEKALRYGQRAPHDRVARSRERIYVAGAIVCLVLSSTALGARVCYSERFVPCNSLISRVKAKKYVRDEVFKLSFNVPYSRL